MLKHSKFASAASAAALTCVGQAPCDVAHLHACPADVLLPVACVSILAHEGSNEHHVASVAQRTPAAEGAALCVSY
jgi:hypothetical protein